MEIICCSVYTRYLVELWLRTEDLKYTEQPREIQCESEHAQVSQFPPWRAARRRRRHGSWQSGLARAARAKAERLTKSRSSIQSARRHTRVASAECTGPTT